MSGYSLRPCTAGDEAFARRLHREAYEDVVTRQFGCWDEARQRSLFDAKWDPARFQVVVADSRTVGLLAIERRADGVFVHEIQLLPVAQGRGIGRGLMEEVQSVAAAAGLPVRLRVLRLNRARSLYERLGFCVYDETDTHFLMEWLPVKA